MDYFVVYMVKHQALYKKTKFEGTDHEPTFLPIELHTVGINIGTGTSNSKGIINKISFSSSGACIYCEIVSSWIRTQHTTPSS